MAEHTKTSPVSAQEREYEPRRGASEEIKLMN